MYIHISMGFMGTGVGYMGTDMGYMGMDEGIHGHRRVCLLVFCLLTASVVDGMKTCSETIALKIDLVNVVFGKTNVLK